ncbi:MAG TPA: FxSxx-COOH system tetratricopeptide repeat protein [Pilimelia sp.]|nr:FxSxx-COOH system tetratricopeptide repeat protein [Pilimelia sp.]
MTTLGDDDAVDLFVSYAGPDRPWAEWASEQLDAAGYSVELDVWDWAAGSNAVLNMSDALTRARRVLALWSAAYFERERFTTDEWTAVFAERPDAEGRHRLVPVRVQEVTPPPILASVVYRDLFGLDERRAREALLAAVGGGRRRSTPSRFPGATSTERAWAGGARVPGSYPAVWNAPRRHPAFTGREVLLAALRQRLTSGDRALVQALYGMGGVGKTQLAIEYAHLFVGEYDLVWWIDADRAELIGEQLSALAVAAGWVEPKTVVSVAVQMAMDRLRGTPRWLLVYDNAEAPETLAPWLPSGPGHVVITSRNSGFARLAAPVGVDVFARAESVALLRQYLPALPDADRLAAALGDLPLALTQAAGFIAETGMPVTEYLAELADHEHAAELLAEAKPVDYPAPLAAAITMSVNRLSAEDPAAVQLLRLCAALAPEPIPVDWFAAAPTGVLPEPLATIAGTTVALRRSVGRLGRYGLARTTDGVQMHRLTHAVVTAADPNLADTRDRVAALLAAATPKDMGEDPATWPRWAQSLPHLLAANPYDTNHHGLRWATDRAAWYLLARGDIRTGFDLAHRLYQRWRDRLGPDHPSTQGAADTLARAYRDRGQYREARRLDEDALAYRRRVRGDDDPGTLASANNLAMDLRGLGDHERARQLDEDALARRRRVLGDDHPSTLNSANNLAINLRALGESERARQLDEDTLAHRRRILGHDHPSTLNSANNLAIDLSALGEHERARQLDEDTLARRRRVLGDDHPSTLSSANNLAIDLRALGEHEQARQLDEDTLARRRRVLGDDHPDTLSSADSLAEDLRALGEHEQARQLDEDTLAHRRALGGDHPSTDV